MGLPCSWTNQGRCDWAEGRLQARQGSTAQGWRGPARTAARFIQSVRTAIIAVADLRSTVVVGSVLRLPPVMWA